MVSRAYFEQHFPSLKDKYLINREVNWKAERLGKPVTIYSSTSLVEVDDVVKFTADKEVVRRAFYKLLKRSEINHETMADFKYYKISGAMIYAFFSEVDVELQEMNNDGEDDE